MSLQSTSQSPPVIDGSSSRWREELRRDLLGFHLQAQREAGDVVEIRFPRHSNFQVSQPELLGAIFQGSREAFRKGRRWDNFRQVVGGGVLTAEPERWMEQRRTLQREWACVQLSSTSQWMEGRIGWGVRLYSPVAPSVTMAGVSRRPVVVGEDIVAHLCLDVAFTFDLILVDGAPATRFIAALQDEMESGRVLEEYPIVERRRK
jgi:hypothetical protein